MPGFSICGQGGPANAKVETRRKHRWLFEVLADFPANVMVLLQSAQRPNFKFEEPEMHHNQEVAYFAGKQSWEPITLTWYDSEQDPDCSLAIAQWIDSVSTINGGSPPPGVSPPAEYKKDGQLLMLNGWGNPTERWQVCNCWPKESNWGELDYTSTDIATIEVQMRYDRAIRFGGAAGL